MQNDYLYIIYPLFFLWMLYKIKDKRQHLTYAIIVLIYFASTCVAFWGRRDYDIYHIENISPNLVAIVFHCITLFLLLFPFRLYDRYRYIVVTKTDTIINNIIIVSVIFCCLFSIIYEIPKINITLLLNDSQELRQLLAESTDLHSSNSYIYTINRLGGIFSSSAIGLFFYMLRINPNRKNVLFLLFICSFTSVISGLVVAAREYIIKTAFIFFVFYVLNKDYIVIQWKRRIKFCGIIISSLLVFVFATITILRFTNSSNYSNPIGSLFSYFSQGFLYFSAFYDEFTDGIANGSMSFPFFTGSGVSRFDTNSLVISSLKLNNFTTTVGSWMIDGGVFLTVLAVIIYNRMFTVIGKLKLSIFTYVYLGWAFEFIFSSLFFFNSVMDLQRVFAMCFIISLHLITRKFATK